MERKLDHIWRAMLHHETELPITEMLVDTAEFTELMSLARDIAYGQRGVLTDRDFASQLNCATCLSLLLNIIAAWNTRYMQAALDHLRATGYPAQDSDLEHLSPITSVHINVHGSHHLDLLAPQKRKGQLRPLRTTPPLF
ncbi:Tn3 family transposase [Dictyobacter arantiisoli]|uniref:Tn3 transposase DDE domain-containing protein n=1 Tax=Dictyobacter arantiisoli TaxID=2014874 RepID=A0A5A5TE11_9CHLR|nr:Tn3 family transposase [Dictyobacter arantiisoli]GCF09780.1 hypothetical protein KDI_33440 [Dictyobacter arantiisoli]